LVPRDNLEASICDSDLQVRMCYVQHHCTLLIFARWRHHLLLH